MWLIVLSSLVSLFTLAVLFWRPRQVEKKWIPSWFLGNTQKKNSHIKLIFTRPPFVPFVLVLVATLCFAAVYYPRRFEKEGKPSNSSVLLWFDPSFSAHMARASQDFSPETAASLALERHEPIYGLETSFLLQQGQPKLETRLQPLENRAQVLAFLKAQEERPFSPFAQSLDLKKANELLATEPGLTGKLVHLLVFSDGKQESLSGFETLKKYFKSAQLVKSLPYQRSAEQVVEVVPRALADVWQTSRAAPQANRGEGDFLTYDKQNILIPSEARPQLFVKTYAAKEKNMDVLDKQTEPQTLPLMIVCAQNIPGHVDFDSFAPLRQLSQWFQTQLIEMPCEDATTGAVSTAQNLWRYRDHAIWVVPLNTQVLASFKEQSRFWIPRGFNPRFDSLVYVAPAYLPGDVLETVPLQLDANVFPVPLRLAPLPPRGELGFKIPGERTGYQGAFREYEFINENLPVAWKASALPIFYLRTPVSTPNGELARSRNWLQFWLRVASDLPPANSALKHIELRDASRFTEEWAAAGLSSVSLSAILNLKTLTFEQPRVFELGLYKTAQNSEEMILFTTKFHDSNKNFMTEDSFAKNFVSPQEKTQGAQTQDQSETPYSIVSMVVAFCAALSLLWLWKKDKKSTSVLLCFVCVYASPQQSVQAQELISSVYHIAWCGEQVPAAVQQRYTALRNVLMRRGTIQLPAVLEAHACQPNAAEVWWTNDLNTLSLSDLKDHVASGGVFILEGTNAFPTELLQLNDNSIGRMWEAPAKKGMFYRSFYLLNTFDGCSHDTTQALMLRKKANAQSPFGLVTSASFLGQKPDCFAENMDYRVRSFVNLIYALFTTDYKEDQMQLPEILKRVRSLGLEP